mmetsp:Transcript_35341/g.99281  ORF Transcript_35341/g.99281 Transcript_35341/m.99281 type:complete len:320 (-) Transcript_35341:138-1097(-)
MAAVPAPPALVPAHVVFADTLPDELVDELYSRHVSDEALDVWAEQQRAALGERCLAGKDRADLSQRCAALQLALWMNRLLGGVEICPLRFTQLLDTGAILVGRMPPGEVFSRVAAAWMLAVKSEHGDCIELLNGDELDALAAAASHFSKACGGAEVTLRDIRRDEVALFQDRWPGATMLSIGDWTAAILERFSVVAHGVLADCLGEVLAIGTRWATEFSMAVPVSADQPPRETATGVCGAVLLALGLLPRSAVQPQLLDGGAAAALGAGAEERRLSDRIPSRPLGVVVPAIEFAARCEFDVLLGRTATVIEILQRFVQP